MDYGWQMSEKLAADYENAKTPIERLRIRCLQRGASGIKGFSRRFRQMDDDKSRGLSKEEFRKGVLEYNIDASDADVDELFRSFDKDGSGSIDFEEFLTSLRPPMSSARGGAIAKAFKRADTNGDQVITIADLKLVYNAKEHPRVRGGTITEDDIFREFLKNFDSPDDADGKVSAEEFMNYYSGLSVSFDSDQDFLDLLEKTWC